MKRRVYDGTEKTRMATIVLRGTTSNHLDDLERAIHDGVNVVKSILKDPRLVPSAWASELELAKRVEIYGSGLKGLSQHAKNMGKRWRLYLGRWVDERGTKC
jgi:T-complex protein 1 subunit theta